MSQNVLRGVALVFAGLAAWLLVLRPAPSTDPATVDGTNVPAPLVLPSGQDSLDHEVIGALEHDVVYALELRAAPDHRLLAFDPASGEVTTLHALSDTEQVLGLSLSPSGDRLAVAHARDVTQRGNGVALLAIDGGRGLATIVEGVQGIYLTDPVWADEETVLLTRTDVRAGAPTFEVVSVDVTSGAVAPVVADAVTPAFVDGVLHFLEPDEQGNGLAVRRLGEDGGVAPVVRADGDATIDHLLGLPSGDLLFAVHQVEEGGIVIGAPALAHTGPSVWWTTAVDAPAPGDLGLGASSVLDAGVTRTGELLAVDREGLSITRDGTRHRLITTRSFRFVAG